MRKQSLKDPVVSKVMRYTREGWPTRLESNDPVERFRKIAESLSTCHTCLLYGCRVMIPANLRKQVLLILHEGHFGIQRMKQLARTAVYWPNIDADIMDLCRKCTTCAEHQNEPTKVAVHPWMLPEKPWSHTHMDHAINFMGYNWLVVINSHTKYPCIHATQSISTKSTNYRLAREGFCSFRVSAYDCDRQCSKQSVRGISTARSEE